MISFDKGKTYTEIDSFYGPELGQMDSGTFNENMPQLENALFTLGWKWYSDVLVNGSYLFAIDNVLVTADPTAVESDAA